MRTRVEGELGDGHRNGETVVIWAEGDPQFEEGKPLSLDGDVSRQVHLQLRVELASVTRVSSGRSGESRPAPQFRVLGQPLNKYWFGLHKFELCNGGFSRILGAVTVYDLDRNNSQPLRANKGDKNLRAKVVVLSRNRKENSNLSDDFAAGNNY